MVHRDFKPANVLLGPDGPRVVDFGIARLTDAATITSGIIGTPAFMSPEQLSGERPTSAVDIFAWAVTIVFAATGRPAFHADTIPAVMHRILFEEPDVTGVPPALRAVVSDCLSKDPARRPSGRDLMLRLVDPSASPAGLEARAAAPDPATMTGGGYRPAWRADPTEPPPAAGVPGRRWRTPVLIGSGVAAAAALSAAGFLLFSHGSPAASRRSARRRGEHAGLRVGHQPGFLRGRRQAIPAAYAGTWGGTAQMTQAGGGPSLNSSITFTFTAGARTVHEDNQTCVNTLTLTQVLPGQLTFSEPGTPECVGGIVTFRLLGGKLEYRWFNDLAENRGLLARS